MSLRPIVCDFLSIVTLQSFLLGRFERLVFRPPTVLEKPFWAPPFRFHRFDYGFGATHLYGCQSNSRRDSWQRRLRYDEVENRRYVPTTRRLSRSKLFWRRSKQRRVQCVSWAWPPSPISSMILRLKAGRSSGLRLVTRPLSTTTSSSTQRPPALRTSVLMAGQEVNFRPRTTSASIKSQGP